MGGGSARLKLSRYVVTSPRLSHGSSAQRRVLLSTRDTRPVTVSESVWVALNDGELDKLPSQVTGTLVDTGVLVDGGEDELSSVLAENTAAIASSDVLRHVIQPTAACQLGCDYCGQEHFPRQLSLPDQDRLVDRLDRRLRLGGYSELSISWFGAEPLLGLRTMRRLSPRLIALADRHRVRYSSKIVTNGLLLSRARAREIEGGHSVSAAEITLDGPREVHDARRHVKNGRPSFDQIMRNLVEIAEEPDILLELSIRCNVDRRNVDTVDDLIDDLADRGLQRRVSFQVASVYSWGNRADQLSLPGSEFADREIEWFARMYNRGFALDLLPRRQSIVCLAVRRHGEVTDALGNVFNCTEAPYVPAYGDPNRLMIGTLEDREPRGSVPFGAFNDEIGAGDHLSCQRCAMLPACGGACPKQWSEGNTPCPPAKTNIGERLALWYASKHDGWAS